MLSSHHIQQTVPAIYYRAEGFNTNQSKLMGRQAAGESFLKAISQQSESGFPLTCYALTQRDAQDFQQKVHQFSEKPRSVTWIQPGDFEALTAQGTLFIPGPGLEEFAWQRRHYQQQAYSLCGITHTTASESVMASIGALLTAPVQPWDALICTSQSVRHMVQTILGNYQEYLSERFGFQEAGFAFQLPVIPLGVDAEQYKPTPEKLAMGQQLRIGFGISPDTVVVLFMGRISFHAKANPYPMFLALEQAAQRTGKPICLILAGWYANDQIQQEFQQAAQQLCPSVRLLELDGRKPFIRDYVWYAADLFTSLSDNIQETFGLTPIEAKAAGLPVVVSDWDGYRETVRNGTDGLLIPTVMPIAPCGISLALRYAVGLDDYDHYIGQVSQTTAVSIEAATNAYVQLIEQPELRAQLGQNGQQDVQTRFDWSVILKTYHSLWLSLGEIRANTPECVSVKPNQPANPLRDDPYRLFQSYPSLRLTPKTLIAIDDVGRFSVATALRMTQVGQALHLSPEQMQAILSYVITAATVSLEAIQLQFPDLLPTVLYRTIGWLLKMGLIQLVQ